AELRDGLGHVFLLARQRIDALLRFGQLFLRAQIDRAGGIPLGLQAFQAALDFADRRRTQRVVQETAGELGQFIGGDASLFLGGNRDVADAGGVGLRVCIGAGAALAGVGVRLFE